MRNVITIMATVTVFGASLLVIEQHRRANDSARQRPPTSAALVSVTRKVVRAPGRIEGRTESIELRARIAEQIREIHVAAGQQVSVGQVLVSLDSDRLESQRDLAAALLAQAEAEKLRLENGYRQSEIEAAREEYEAAKARSLGAERAYNRGMKLYSGNAVSRQELDDRHAEMAALKATSAAAGRRLETMELPAREDEIMAAAAVVGAAKSRLRIAQINLDRSQIKAPIEGTVLAVEAEIGELTGPDSPQPLVIISDTTRLRALAEVDEYDALSLRLGQAAHITSDGVDGVLARGKVTEIEPQMNPKRLFGQWAGERVDTYSRRVWIDLEGSVDLPVGLPVDVFIQAQ